MKFNCDYFNDLIVKRSIKKRNKYAEWHEYFAWFPIYIKHNDCRWLEKVYRRSDWLGKDILPDNHPVNNNTFWFWIYTTKEDIKGEKR